MQAIQKKTKQFFDNAFENIEKNVQQQAKATVQAVASQVVNQKPQNQGTNESGGKQSQHTGKAYDAATQEVIEDFYESSDPKAAQALQNQRLPKAGELTPQDQMKYQQLKKLLHDEVYYRKLVDRKSGAQEHVEEEQQEEQEKQMEDLQLEDQKKQDDDIALRMQTHKAEQFPGASG